MGEGETGLAKSKAVPIDQFSWEGGREGFSSVGEFDRFDDPPLARVCELILPGRELNKLTFCK